MLAWISANYVTIIVCAVLLLTVAAILFTMVKNRKNGRSSCGGNCGSCPMGGSCHKS